MFAGVALAYSELPVGLVEAHGLGKRVHDRGGEPEVQFRLRDRDRVLPVWLGGQVEVVRWGSRRGQSRGLPLTAWARTDTLKAGVWGAFGPEPVVIPATMGLDRGVWFRIREGVRGLLVHDERERPVVYVLVEPASHYYKVMTRSAWMPALIGEVI